jgi:hypothetical protein
LLLFIPQTPPPNLFLIRLDNVGFSLNASTPAIQNKTSTTTPHSINKYTRVNNIDVLLFTGLYEKRGLQSDLREENKARIVILRAYVQCMTKIIKPDLSPGEFKCRTCNTMWSSYMKNSILCIDITERHGLHDFDFAKPII